MNRVNGNVVIVCLTFVALCIVGGVVRIIVHGQATPLIQLLTIVIPLAVPGFGAWWTAVKSKRTSETAVVHAAVAASNTNGKMADQFQSIRDDIRKLQKVMVVHLQTHAVQAKPPSDPPESSLHAGGTT